MAQLGTHHFSCNSAGTNLCLHPPGQCPAEDSCSTSTSETSTSRPPPTTPSIRHQQHQHQQQPVPEMQTNPTEMQTRVILSAARQEVARLVASLAGRCWEDQCDRGGQEESDGDRTVSVFAACPHREAVGMSMKGSLRRFLEKRRSRLQEASASPYCSVAR